MRAAYIMGIVVLVGTAARASETVNYSYDSKGRLIRVIRAGGVNNGIVSEYSHDKADNRVRVKVTGSSNTPP